MKKTNLIYAATLSVIFLGLTPNQVMSAEPYSNREHLKSGAQQMNDADEAYDEAQQLFMNGIGPLNIDEYLMQLRRAADLGSEEAQATLNDVFANGVMTVSGIIKRVPANHPSRFAAVDQPR